MMLSIDCRVSRLADIILCVSMKTLKSSLSHFHSFYIFRSCPAPCVSLNTCASCSNTAGCTWCASSGICYEAQTFALATSMGQCVSSTPPTCPSTCIQFTSCQPCLAQPGFERIQFQYESEMLFLCCIAPRFRFGKLMLARSCGWCVNVTSGAGACASGDASSAIAGSCSLANITSQHAVLQSFLDLNQNATMVPPVCL